MIEKLQPSTPVKMPPVEPVDTPSRPDKEVDEGVVRRPRKSVARIQESQDTDSSAISSHQSTPMTRVDILTRLDTPEVVQRRFH
jgi:hypothetical protein